LGDGVWSEAGACASACELFNAGGWGGGVVGAGGVGGADGGVACDAADSAIDTAAGATFAAPIDDPARAWPVAEPDAAATPVDTNNVTVTPAAASRARCFAMRRRVERATSRLMPSRRTKRASRSTSSR